MGRVIAKGDGISIYSRASSLQGWLSDGKRSEPLSSAGAAQCLGELYRLFGRRITSGLIETTNIAAKLMKFHEDFVRQEALQMLQNALEGSGGSGASSAYSEAFRIIMRVGVGDKSFIVRIAAARCLKTFASIGGPGLGVTDLENSASYCVKALEDSLSSVRDSFAEALGALLALGMNPEAQVQPRGKSHPTPTRKLEAGLQKHLILPFTRVSGVRVKDLRIGLALSWVFFLQAMRLKYLCPDTELQKFSLQALEMLHGNASIDAHALACVLYILRVGVTDQMTEPTQRIFLILLGRQLESPDVSPSMKVAVLRTLCYLLATLGEVPLEFKEVLDNTVVAALSHSLLLVRLEAALTLRALAEVDPTCVGGLIAYGVTTLHALRDSAAIGKGDRLKVDLDSLHGQAIVLAALVSISPRLRLGYPARLPKSVLEVSKKMLTGFSRNPMTATVEKEAGWLLLASFITSMPKEELEDQVFDILSLWAAPFGGNPERKIKQAEDLILEIRVWSAAIEALTAFIRSFVSSTVTIINTGILLQPVLVYLSGALSYISSLADKQLQNLKSSMDLFIIRTLTAYQSLPDPMAYKSDHPQIIKICTTPFRDPSGCEESSCLRLLLDKRDACLGPWIPGRDWFEDELRAFEGGKDGIMPCVWDMELSSFPQPETISKTLVNQMLLCFGTIFATQDSSANLVLLGMIDQSLKAGKKQLWHVANTTNACVGLLAGLKALLALRPQALGMEILSSAQAIFLGILSEGEICAAQRRASSEGLGLIARLGNDIFTARMVCFTLRFLCNKMLILETRSLLGDLVGTTDSSYSASIAVALGCIHRSAGGMALSTLVPSTVSSISLLAKSSNADLQAWSLHGLLLTIEAAGLSYVSHVQATLFLAMEILLSEENGWVNLRQGIGRLINAIVAVLGPELSPGSTFFSRCKSVVAEISSGQETSTLLECVRFTQQLVVFAPQAVSVHSHVQTLLSTLSSRQPTLRHLAVSTLRHLIEKDPVSIIDEQIEVNLFGMLDEETDPEIVNLVRSTIIRLLYASCPSRSLRWIALCRNMVLETSTRRNVAENRTRSKHDPASGNADADDRTYYGEDDEDMITSSRDGQMQDSTVGSIVHPKREKHLRYRTRVFAAECLSYLPAAVGTDPAHFDLSLARERISSSGDAIVGDWLVLHLQELVALAYQISTGQFENMQPIGVELLVTIMDKFGNLPDPELPGHLMMEQYQAQLVSAVRTALATSSGPPLLEAGLQLATKILTSSITSGDPVALQRLFSLISRPLNDFKDLYYPSFAEWVACKIKIRLLAAHASVKCYTYDLLREKQNNLPDEYLSLIPMFSNSSSILGKHWISILNDYTHICFGLESKSNYKPFLDGIQSSLVSSKVQSCLDEVWPVILKAIALDAVPMKFETDGNSKSSSKDVSKSIFISGYSMVRLELREFYFLWGFSLLVLFQGQQVEVGKHVIPFPSPGKIKSGGDSMVKDQNILGLKFYEIALLVLQSLSLERFFSQEFLTLYLCRELLQVLTYPDQITCSRNRLAIPVLSQVKGLPFSNDPYVDLSKLEFEIGVCATLHLSQIVQACPEKYFQMDDFAFVAMELCVKYQYEIFQSADAITQDQQSFKELISALFVTAETIVRRMYPKRQWKLILGFLSTSYKCLKDASTDSCLSTVISFTRNILPLLKKHLGDKAELCDDAIATKETVLGAWQNEILHLSQDCIKSIHILDSKRRSSCKLLHTKLSFCLEEALSLSRLAHETQQLGQSKDNNMFLFTLYRQCIKCMQITLMDSNIQVQTVGLYVLKSIFQRELGESANMENNSFILFSAGELLGDIFSLIHKISEKIVTRESLVIAGECLRLLVLLHTLSQASECQKDVMNLLLEAIIMVVSVSTEVHSQELIEIKSNAMRLVSHLAQIPSSAVQFREVLLAMPVTRKQQLQDIIRASVTQGQNAAQVTSTSSSPSPIIKIPLQMDKEPQANVSELVTAHPNTYSMEKGEEEDDDDDWDAFQSFPADNASTAAQPEVAGVEAVPASNDNSPILESNHKRKTDFEESSDFEHHEDSIQVNDMHNPEGCGENVLTRQGNGNDLQEFSTPQPSENVVVRSSNNPLRGNEGPVIRSDGDGNDEELSDPQSVEDAEESNPNHYLQVGGQTIMRSRDDGSDLQKSSNSQWIEDAEELNNERHLETSRERMMGTQSDENSNQEISDPQPAEGAENTSDGQQLGGDGQETAISLLSSDAQPLQGARMATNKNGDQEIYDLKPV
ncbi:protein SWEETIE [Magnolia sinica]|uniref:protein SWEETIE n=1 Tax=Magnolia sinica TaxID=86752 RepID=UPI00265A8DE4|nr:protein SWEETIE [Magnolia sinica]